MMEQEQVKEQLARMGWNMSSWMKSLTMENEFLKDLTKIINAAEVRAKLLPDEPKKKK